MEIKNCFESGWKELTVAIRKRDEKLLEGIFWRFEWKNVILKGGIE